MWKSNCYLNLITGYTILGSKNCNQAFVMTDSQCFTLLLRKFGPHLDHTYSAAQPKYACGHEIIARHLLFLDFWIFWAESMVTSITTSCPSPEAAKAHDITTMFDYWLDVLFICYWETVWWWKLCYCRLKTMKRRRRKCKRGNKRGKESRSLEVRVGTLNVRTMTGKGRVGCYDRGK